MKDKSSNCHISENDSIELAEVNEITLTSHKKQIPITLCLSVIAVIMLLARMAGHNTIKGIFEYFSVNKDRLKNLIDGYGGQIPSPQTLRRVQTILNTDNLNALLKEFFKEGYKREKHDDLKEELLKSDLLSSDVKSKKADSNLINDSDRDNRTVLSAVQMFSLKYGFALAQQALDTKKMESRAISEILKRINVKNTILSWDALNLGASTMESVIEANADFLCSLWRNKSLTCDDIKSAFKDCDNDYLLQGDRVFRDHLYTEYRHIEIAPSDKVLSKDEQRRFKHIKSIICVTTAKAANSCVKDNEHRAKSELFYISSIEVDFDDDAFIEKMDNLIRDRWSVESSDFMIEVNFDQDRLPLCNRDYIQNCEIFADTALDALMFVRKAIAYSTGKTAPSIRSLQHASNDVKAAFEFLYAYVRGDKSIIAEVEAIYNYGIVKKKDPVIEDNYVQPQKVPKNRLEAIAMYGSKKARELGY